MADSMGTSFAQGVVPIVGMTADQSRAYVTNLIFGSMWMGAMGWELFMTLPFDWRLAKETSWRSFPSALHSAAYYASRYSTMAFLCVYVATNATAAPIMDANQCQRRVTADAAMFVVSEMSVLLVFLLRTIAIWNLNRRVIAALTLCWVVTLGFAITIPVKGNGVILKGFCTWDITGAWVGVSMTLYAVASFACLVLTVIKLNRQGWRGLLHSLAPPSTRSIDSADVSRLLIQRTTLFFSIVLLCIIAADVVYFTAPFALWQLFAVPAYLAISSGLAGRIFRRSWKLTHCAAYNRPPSYFPGVWRNEDDDGSMSAQGGQQRTSRHGVPPTALNPADVLSLNHNSYSERSPSFVEGEFRGAATMSVKSLALPTREEKRDLQSGVDIYTDEMLARRRASEPAKAFRTHANGSNDDIIVPINGDGMDVNDPESSHNAGVFGISAAPAFLPRVHRDYSSRLRATSRRHSAYGTHSPLPFGYMHGSSKGKALSVKYQDDEQPRPTTAPDSRRRRQTEGHIDDASARWNSFAMTDAPRPATMSSVARTEWARLSAANGNLRDDLIPAPSRSRLWLDSGAERARMEAAAGASTSCLSDGTSITSNTLSSSGNSARSQQRPPTAASRRTAANKRLILESASVAGENLQVKHSWHGRGRSDSASNSVGGGAPSGSPTKGPLRGQSSRSSFLASSPAMVSNTPSTADLRADRNNYDFDAIRRALTDAEQNWRTHSASAATSTFSDAMVIAEESSERSVSTVHGRTAGQRARPVTAPEPAQTSSDPLNAFRQAVEEDVERNAQRAIEDRPRTSRGGAMNGFGNAAMREVSPMTKVGGHGAGMQRSSSMQNDERPRTRTGDGGPTVKPFGADSNWNNSRELYDVVDDESSVGHASTSGRRATLPATNSLDSPFKHQA